MFLANYGDGLSDLELPVMIDAFQQSNAVGSLLLVQPTASFDIVQMGGRRKIAQISPLCQTDIWINGGFFVLRKEIFRYIHPGDELVRQPFQRLIEKGALLAHKCTGFWQCMDTFKDKQCLEELNQGAAPWKVWRRATAACANESGYPDSQRMIPLNLGAGLPAGLQILCLGCHSDDIEIGCGGTILRLAEQYPGCAFHWVVFSAIGVRAGGGAARGGTVRRPGALARG